MISDSVRAARVPFANFVILHYPIQVTLDRSFAPDSIGQEARHNGRIKRVRNTEQVTRARRGAANQSPCVAAHAVQLPFLGLSLLYFQMLTMVGGRYEALQHLPATSD